MFSNYTIPRKENNEQVFSSTTSPPKTLKERPRTETQSSDNKCRSKKTIIVNIFSFLLILDLMMKLKQKLIQTIFGRKKKMIPPGQKKRQILQGENLSFLSICLNTEKANIIISSTIMYTCFFFRCMIVRNRTLVRDNMNLAKSMYSVFFLLVLP